MITNASLTGEELACAETTKDVPYTVLETLQKKDIELFIEMLMEEKIEKNEAVFMKRSADSTNRFIQSLKSLFNYLTQESENDEGECYFYRNVMAKIKTPKKQESTAFRSKRISASMYSGKQMTDFLNFVKYDYVNTLKPRAAARFKHNRLRDIAIISLLQGSGARVNDMEDVKTYLDERDRLYKPDKKNQFVFLTKYRGKANPITVESIEKLVKKYSEAFMDGKRLSPHKLRHSFAKGFLDEGGSLSALRDQLGHNSIETTSLYMNVSQEEQRSILRRMDSKTKNYRRNTQLRVMKRGNLWET